jgi:hypothetical protein
MYQEVSMVTLVELIYKLRSPDTKRVLQAVEELRVRGWLGDGSLKGIPLCHTHLQGADLLSANFENVDFHQADLAGADLSMASLKGTKLTRVNFQRANLSHTDIRDADLYKANLKDAHNLTDEQLLTARRLYGATMVDGEPYDGRYNLEGDLAFARWGRVDIDDPEAMAEFYGVPLDSYLRGQNAAEVSLA